jgi:hypothetical protein
VQVPPFVVDERGLALEPWPCAGDRTVWTVHETLVKVYQTTS